MILTGEAAKRSNDEAFAKSKRDHDEQLAAAKAEGQRRGKAPFDLDKLETLCDTSHEGRLAPREERIEQFERDYYLSFPETMTMEELAKKIEILNQW